MILNSNKYLYDKNNKERIHILHEMRQKNIFNKIDNLIKYKHNNNSNSINLNYELNHFYFNENYHNYFIEYHLKIKIIFN